MVYKLLLRGSTLYRLGNQSSNTDYCSRMAKKSKNRLSYFDNL